MSLVGITCPKCNRFLIEQPKPQVFVCRNCKLAYPMEHSDRSIIRQDYNLAVPMEDVLG
jgi:DNA-directed RNA polymerase subunit M/transcription elongation factor TFIIS